MTVSGWIFMLVSCGAMVVLTAWCFYRVLTRPATTEQMHAPGDIDPHDQED